MQQDPLALLIPSEPADSPPFEEIPASEADAIVEIVEQIAKRVTEGAQSGRALRDAHPKMHGCVEATLEVLDPIPEAYRQGLFANPQSYPCWVRFSNGSGTAQRDQTPDGRGMAIKVMNVAESRSTTQDFIMINHPVFFVRNAHDYVSFTKSQMWFFLGALNPFHSRLHELINALRIARRPIANPVNSQYWSMTPFLFGDMVCKYSCRPAGLPSRFVDKANPDFLHENLVAALVEGDAAFDFCVQLRTHPTAMPIEDPTIEWGEASSPFLPVARLTIARQVFDTPERASFGENLSFTPWHGLDAHRPLGGINRVRRKVYEAISTLRHKLNSEARAEPSNVHD